MNYVRDVSTRYRAATVLHNGSESSSDRLSLVVVLSLSVILDIQGAAVVD